MSDACKIIREIINEPFVFIGLLLIAMGALDWDKDAIGTGIFFIILGLLFFFDEDNQVNRRKN
ncbi:hypothetical protein E3E31_10765 [Thermococcus sp. M39]|uniref:hypothetical protein n=1 Tax=unclassified Thermococcus TaxID=2627626 RepID=UPI00143A954B|nr:MULTISPECIES: hypothetical protein [unclassified Thermococcus]NJE08995.1 hypothetical protein [Thermococcus sp. M39]NJE13357.1 hypothetical protein [Thermococcus sp. LS2]